MGYLPFGEQMVEMQEGSPARSPENYVLKMDGI
jgi:hypothetical protein